MKSKQVKLTDEERVLLQTLITGQLRRNKQYEKYEIEPNLKTKDLKDLYQKIAGYEYKEIEKEVKQ